MSKSKTAQPTKHRSTPALMTYLVSLPIPKSKEALVKGAVFSVSRGYRLVVVLPREREVPENWIVQKFPGNVGQKHSDWVQTNRVDELNSEYIRRGKSRASVGERVKQRWLDSYDRVTKAERALERAKKLQVEAACTMIRTFGKSSIVVGDDTYDPCHSREIVFYMKRRAKPSPTTVLYGEGAEDDSGERPRKKAANGNGGVRKTLAGPDGGDSGGEVIRRWPTVARGG